MMRPAPGFLIGGAVLVAATTALVGQVATSFQTPPPRPVASVDASADAAKIAVTAAISGFAFPATIRVATGGSVTWTNADSASHTVTFNDASIPSSEVLGGALTKTMFAKKGTFTYHCDIHASMTGSVEVVDATSTPAEPDPYDPYDPYGP
jgi:plastocyanin